MENLVCHYSFIKGEQRLNSEPCTTPPVFMLGIIYELLCPCLQSLQLGFFGVGKIISHNITITKVAFKENSIDLVQFPLRQDVFQLCQRGQAPFKLIFYYFALPFPIKVMIDDDSYIIGFFTLFITSLLRVRSRILLPILLSCRFWPKTMYSLLLAFMLSLLILIVHRF